ncbi:alpha/beta hydrolase [Flavitalea sp.]|nr:alpha/beta hydrolase-fold protein [Flavitalea sp.]
MIEPLSLESVPLARTVKFDIYTPSAFTANSSGTILLCNDGQDLVSMNFGDIVKHLFETGTLKPIIIVGIHCGDDRMNEYGMTSGPDYKGRGSKGALYQQFVLEELLPTLHRHLAVDRFAEYAYAGFSLGALSAIDIAWNHPELFSKVGVFSGSLWWRSKSQKAKDYNPDQDRLMHRQMSQGNYYPGMKFFFECGELDETEDRNKNGVIDSIDDTFDLMKILVRKGYREGADIKYLQLPDGRHDVATWARALPVFLNWGWGKSLNR